MQQVMPLLAPRLPWPAGMLQVPPLELQLPLRETPVHAQAQALLLVQGREQVLEWPPEWSPGWSAPLLGLSQSCRTHAIGHGCMQGVGV